MVSLHPSVLHVCGVSACSISHSLHTRQEHMSQNITDNKTSKNTRVTRDKHKNMWRRERMRTRVCWVLHTRTRDPRMVDDPSSNFPPQQPQLSCSGLLPNVQFCLTPWLQTDTSTHSTNPRNKIPGGPWSKRTPHAIISQCEALDPTPSAFWPGKPRAPTQASDKTKTIFRSRVCSVKYGSVAVGAFFFTVFVRCYIVAKKAPTCDWMSELRHDKRENSINTQLHHQTSHKPDQEHKQWIRYGEHWDKKREERERERERERGSWRVIEEADSGRRGERREERWNDMWDDRRSGTRRDGTSDSCCFLMCLGAFVWPRPVIRCTPYFRSRRSPISSLR